MKTNYLRNLHSAALVFSLSALTGTAFAEQKHGIAMYGDPALSPDFVSLPYANPDAPTGGQIVTGEVGNFDSLNPHILKGNVPWQLRFLAYESLMGRNWDEPFSLYGLLAESIETAPDRAWVEFTLRPEARFSDGSPVTVEDVLWSYETLGTEGHGRYRGLWGKVASAEATGENTIRFTFTQPEPELALIIGMRPILQKSQWEGQEFTESGLDNIPVTTAPYVITDFDAGRSVTLTRNPDYWGNDLPFRRGTNNLDEIRLEFFTDASVMFEAFKAGEINTFRETNTEKWKTQFDFPSVESGDVVLSEIPHQRPTGITGYVMNTRNPLFADWRVREAMISLFNYPFISETLVGADAPRVTSYFSNSILGMQDGPAEGRVLELLQPHVDNLIPGAIEGYSQPEGSASERNRSDLRRALALFDEAGWTIQDGTLKNTAGQDFSFEILLKQGSSEVQSTIDIYIESLARVGITPEITVVDTAQYKERTNNFDFGMTYYRRGMSLSPGNEQLLYWGTEAADTSGSRNWMGVKSPAVEAMIEAILTAETQSDFRAATRALDRTLTSGRYVIPIWHNPVSYIAHAKDLQYPETLPIYGDWLGFQPDVWWSEDKE